MTTTGPWKLPASHAQERIWFADQVAGEVPVYRVLFGIRAAYPLAADQVVDALSTVVARHEALRTDFHLVDGALLQAVHSTLDLPVERIDLTGEPVESHPARLQELHLEMLHQPLPLDAAPLWRVRLVRVGEQNWITLLVIHHCVFDGASEVNLRAELAEQYAAAAQGRPAHLPELAIQYPDYTMWHRDRLAAGRMDELLDYWRKTLDGLPAVHRVPTDRPRPATRTFAGASAEFPLPEQTAADAAAAARRSGATPFMVLLTAYVALLHRLSGEDDIVVGVPVAGRDVPELQPLIGMFVNMVLLRTDAGGDPTLGELLARVRATALAAWDHQDMPYQKLVEVLATRRDPGVPPLYQLGFNHIPGGFDNDASGVEDDLMLEITDGAARLQYNTALFDAVTAAAMAADYQRILATALAEPGTRLSQLPITATAAGPPQHAVESRQIEYVAPRTAAEELVATVWGEVLGARRIGVHDDFFDLGGHSLLALRVIARLSAITEVEVPIQDFFTDTTLEGVAGLLERLLTAAIDELSDDEAARLAGGDPA